MADSESAPQSTAAEQGGSYPSSFKPRGRSPHEIVDEFSRPGKRPRLEAPVPMTAAAALADAQQRSKSPATADTGENKTSPNPATEALSALMGVTQTAVSKAYTPTKNSTVSDPAHTMSEAVALAAEHMQHPSSDGKSTNDYPQTSPTSMSSFDTQESIAAPSGAPTTVASPLPLEHTPQPSAATTNSEAVSPGDSNRNYSYPAPLLQPQANDPRRGMSLPGSGLRQNTRSPSSKKHKCPYCGTEFTRHHNLKSHLLTHSQEKPYMCPTCSSRFRRLHDLKRHTKLHTGERPHVCPKCNRKFARGDALARHNKGPGGCAGRRASMGSFAGEDDYDGPDDMEGVMYNEPDSMEDIEGEPGKGTPSIRRQAPSGDDLNEDSEHFSRVPSTYPPIQGRPPGGIASGAFPPRNHGPSPSGSSSSLLYPAPPNSSSMRPSNPPVFAQNPLTESPKPISPAQPQSRGTSQGDSRGMTSPNMPHYQHQSPYPRGMGSSGPGVTTQQGGPQLPPPLPDPRFTLPSQGAPTHPPTQPSGPPTHMSGSGPLSSHSNSLSSHGQSGPGSGDNINPMFNKDDRLWAIVQSLEKRVASMQDEINGLKNQLAAAMASQPNRM